MIKYFYGIRKSDNKTISIDDIPNTLSGLKCNCICPICLADFEACSLTGKKRRYFRHHSSNADCPDTIVNESALHKMAKEIIAEELKIQIPKKEIFLSEIQFPKLPKYVLSKITPYTYQPDKVINCQSVELEKAMEQFAPDVVIHHNEGDLFVEIVVTHDIDDKKRIKLEKCGIPTLRIRLNEFINTPISREYLKKIILENSKLKDWIFYPIPESALKDAKVYYEAQPEIIQYFEDKRQKEEIKKEDKKRKKELEKLELLHSQHSNEKLSVLLQPDNYKSELMRLHNDDELDNYASKNFSCSLYHKLPYFIDLPISKEIVFQCDRRIWQGYIFFNHIYCMRKGMTVNADLIFDEINRKKEISIFNTPNNINLKNQYIRDIAINVIKKYLDYLYLLGFVANSIYYYEIQISKTTIPPNQNDANNLFSALRAVDPYSPDIDNLTQEKLNNIINLEKKQHIEETERQRQEERLKKKTAWQEKVDNYDFNKGLCELYDDAGWRYAKCTCCDKVKIARLFYGRFEERPNGTKNLDKGICYMCYQKQKNN